MPFYLTAATVENEKEKNDNYDPNKSVILEEIA